MAMDEIHKLNVAWSEAKVEADKAFYAGREASGFNGARLKKYADELRQKAYKAMGALSRASAQFFSEMTDVEVIFACVRGAFDTYHPTYNAAINRIHEINIEASRQWIYRHPSNMTVSDLIAHLQTLPNDAKIATSAGGVNVVWQNKLGDIGIGQWETEAPISLGGVLAPKGTVLPHGSVEFEMRDAETD